MTKVRNGLIQMQRLISSDWVAYGIVSATIIGVLLETGIIRVSGFEDIDISTYVIFYGGLSIFCVTSQLIILKFVGLLTISSVVLALVLFTEVESFSAQANAIYIFDLFVVGVLAFDFCIRILNITKLFVLLSCLPSCLS
jgi:hypothetical protein